jgi:hypothetical protein
MQNAKHYLGIYPKGLRKTTNPLMNAVFWNVTPRGSCNNRRFGGTYRFRHQGEKIQ